MAWTAPRTWTTGEIVTAAIMNVHVRDNLNAVSTHAHTGGAGLGAATIGTGVQLLIAGGLGMTGVISPTQIAANTDNYAPTGGATASRWRLSTDASRNLTGISISQADGWRLKLINVGSFAIVLKHDVTSTAANRFYCPNSLDFTLMPNQGVDIEYDGTSSRWRVLVVGGGVTATTHSSGTQTATVTTEHQLDDVTAQGEFTLYVDTVNMVAGDVLELRVYKLALTGGTTRVLYKATFWGLQLTDDKGKESRRVLNELTDATSLRFSLKQTYGTSRNFPWKVIKWS